LHRRLALKAGRPHLPFMLMTRTQRTVFIAATTGYSIYYVCRLSLSVVKAPLVHEGVLTESQLGLVGSGLFYAYALGKFVNGFLADRANINRFLSVGLLGTAVINLMLGFNPGFAAFAALWLVNGWFQSMGAPSCIVGLARWFDRKERGTYYGLWSASHNIGEGLTFVAVALLSAHFGWRWGFWGAAMTGLVGVAVVAIWFKNRPPADSSAGLPAKASGGKLSVEERGRIWRSQWLAIRNPTIWLIAAASAFMYVARYAINSWGIFYLELGKGYPRVEAGMIISVSAVSGVLGTIASGWVCDRWFAHNRFLPALLACALNTLSLALFLAVPGGHPWIDYMSMVGFGISIGALICYLGGLLAIDSVPREAAGAALGMVGIASYLGAGLQDHLSGHLIEEFKSGAGSTAYYDFTPVSVFWVGASAVSAVIMGLIWRSSRSAHSRPA
jgi:OPA family sugar phosphate sensor protein UhpC-like MFS transporter